MRFLELRFLAYGPFTGVHLDLSPGQMGVHVIFGPNEAGKSVAMRAVHGLLFGIAVRTGDDFVHDKKKLRIGARIRNGAGDELEFVRRKGLADTILRPGDESPLPGDVLKSFLGGFTGDAFERLFGIGHAALVGGGEDLRRMRGLAGESLFAAGLGGAAVADAQDKLVKQSEEIWTGRGGKLKAALAEFKQVRAEQEYAVRPVREWERLEQKLRDIERDRDTVTQRLQQSRTEYARLTRAVEACALVGKRTLLRQQLELLRDVRALPDSYSAEQRREAMGTIERQGPVLERLRLKLDGEDGIRSRLSALTVDEDLLHLGGEVDALHANCARHVKDAQDVTKLQTRREAFRTDALAILQELRPGTPWEEVESVRVATDRKLRLQELAADERTRRSAPADCAAEENTLRVELAQFERQLDELPRPADPEPLSRAVNRIRKKGELEEQLGRARKEATRNAVLVQNGLDTLGLWTGPLVDLERMPVPCRETIDRFAQHFTELHESDRALSNTIADLRGKAETCVRQINALKTAGDVPTESDLELARSRRQEGWALIRGAWIEGSEDRGAIRNFSGTRALPDAYEACVARADAVADRLRHEAERVATLVALLAEQEDVGRKHGEKREEQKKIAEERAELETGWRAIWEPIGIKQPLLPAEMKPWLSDREAVLGLWKQANDSASDVDALVESIETARRELSDRLAEIGEAGPQQGETLSALLERSDEIVRRFGDLAKLRVSVGNKIADLRKSADLVAIRREKAQQDLECWSAQWAEAVAVIGSREQATGVEVNARLTKIDELAAKLKDIADLDRRIRDMQADAREFEAQVRAVVEAVAQDLRGRPAAEATVELVTRLGRHRDDAHTRASLEKDLVETEQQLEDAQAEFDVANATLQRLCRLAETNSIDELETREVSSKELRTVQRRLSEIDELLAELAGGQSAQDLIAAAADPPALTARAAALEDEINMLESERADVNQRVGETRKEMEAFDGSGVAADADERSLGILARIRDEAGRYVRLRVAAAFLNQQIERHRAATQDPILTRAGVLFAGLTCGSFAGLRTGWDEDESPVVQGVRPDRETFLNVRQMSDGARDQLYLALRLAYLERQIESREPLPLIVDDILVNFDGCRS